MDLREPEISIAEILFLADPCFGPDNVCLVTGAAGGVGRAAAAAAAANKLMTVGLDRDEEGGRYTQGLARRLGGQMIFIKTEPGREEDIRKGVAEAARLGNVRYMILSLAGPALGKDKPGLDPGELDLVWNECIRSAFLLSYLGTSLMLNSGDGTGVIALAAFDENPPQWSAGLVSRSLVSLSESISAWSNGRVRSFGIFPGRGFEAGGACSGSALFFQKCKPVEVANLIIFGLSEHAGLMSGLEWTFHGDARLTSG